MTSMLADPGAAWAEVVRIWSAQEFRQGWQPEIDSGVLSMAPPPNGTHNRIADRIHRALVVALDDSLGIYQTQALAVRSIGSIFIPDLCVVPGDRVPPGTEPVHSQDVLLTVEITSAGNPEHDRKRKLWAYAHGQVSQYLLVDVVASEPMISLFREPVNGVYKDEVRIPLGGKVVLGPPLEAVIDSALFPGLP